MSKVKSNRKKLKDAIIKHCNLRNKDYKLSHSTFSHPKTGKPTTYTDIQWYIQEDLEKLLDKFFPE